MIKEAICSGEEPGQNPRPVSRGLNLQLGFLGLDSFYLVIEYPYDDVYELWASLAMEAKASKLYEGVVVDEFVIRRGGNGYKLSVWDGDARLYLTDQVNDNLKDTPAEGQGMGMMLQLGPKWLRKHGEILFARKFLQNIFAQLVIFGVEHPEDYRMRLNRMDIAADLIGLPVSGLDIDTWREGWVGYATRKTFHDSAQTGKLEGLSVGSSEGAVRFKVYDKVTESIKRGTSGFWHSVWDIAEDSPVHVARLEWSIKCYEARFSTMRYLEDFTFEGYLAVLNYAYLKWGRLCTPDPDDTNQTRWELAPLWEDLKFLIDDWSFNFRDVAHREYDYQPDLSETYLRSALGWIGGLMARVGLENGTLTEADIYETLMYLDTEGLSITDKAKEKFAILSRLAGRKSHGTSE